MHRIHFATLEICGHDADGFTCAITASSKGSGNWANMIFLEGATITEASGTL